MPPIHAEAVPLSTDADGVIRLAHSRITLDTLILAFMEGATAEEIAQQYPSLELADIYAVIAYYLRHRSEVEQYLRGRQKQANVVRKQNEKRFAPQGIRARLLSRRREEA
ncbi:MAG: DUF433 domain-containing protein [Chloroflexi bacterium]|nr:DUF433 domain-containing protein [Chloroflexota bacterium]